MSYHQLKLLQKEVELAVAQQTIEKCVLPLQNPCDWVMWAFKAGNKTFWTSLAQRWTYALDNDVLL